MIETSKPFALISVSQKNGLLDFAAGLQNLGFNFISTGGTARFLEENGFKVTQVSDLTGFAEILDGRVKSLHPLIHGSLLYRRDSAEHCSQAEKYKLIDIKVLAVNLYPFESEAEQKKLKMAAALEFIDIGGPAMLRAAAKNHPSVFSVCDPEDYSRVLAELNSNKPSTQLTAHLAVKVFRHTAAYDALVSRYLDSLLNSENKKIRPIEGNSSQEFELPESLPASLTKLTNLRYGENPHQQAALYKFANGPLATEELFTPIFIGKELSFNNYLDLDAAWQLVRDLLPLAALAIIKHTNPCGVATADSNENKSAELFSRAYAADPKSAFGGIVACSTTIDEDCAKLISQGFYECVVAPEYTLKALTLLRSKKNLRILRANKDAQKSAFQMRQLASGVLLQSQDSIQSQADTWQCVTKTTASPSALLDLELAFRIVKHLKSNAIALVKNQQSIGLGCGQVSRIDALLGAIGKAKEFGFDLKDAALASDAFFPFADCVEIAATHQITSIVQPGGSLKDKDSIHAADKTGIAMYFTGSRHFRH
ncbi:MAG: bifunctional phosphoribosylaminoimidazolecarboxamide formyltransferase/IMP cyclohydrolase [Oligoflexales bacterium]|nr:bifunctional phosphoribosylaminoimidazolecarboxamide formyltransferase/IMP cyclohydrolase [Oligoflexales bacterium]